MHRYLRRLTSLLAVFIGLPLTILLAPFVLVIAGLIDLVTGRRDLPLPRLWILLVVFLAHEWAGQAAAAWIWVRHRGGRSSAAASTAGWGSKAGWDRANQRMEGWWTDSLLRWARRLFGVVIELPDVNTLPTGDVIVLSRHASMIDAIIPAWIFARLLDRPVHYVLKKELRWSPNLDVFGRRLDNHFVARGGNTEQEVANIEALAAGAAHGHGLVIFPEGTYATPASRERVQRSLARRGEETALALAERLTELLPPKPAGTLALLRRRPLATIVVFGHVGLEGVAEFSGLRRNLPVSSPIVVEWWTYDPADLPPDDVGRTSWLQERWEELDRWVADRR